MEINLTALLIIYITTITIVLFVLNEMIKASVRKGIRDALKKELFSLKAYKIAELKHMGITEQDIKDAKNYLNNSKRSLSDLNDSNDYWNTGTPK